MNDFLTGNSGNRLYNAVVKIGPGVSQEAAYCQLLGPNVCPKIYSIGVDIYSMERLEIAHRNVDLILRMEDLLEEKVWSRPALPWSMDIDWREKLKVYGIDTPSWVKPSAPCMCHGDPTASNALMRGNQLLIGDPRPPRDFIPQCRETDVGRLIQSVLLWEEVAYKASKVKFKHPRNWNDQAIFWAGAAAARIEYLERRRDNREMILEWCKIMRSVCNV